MKSRTFVTFSISLLVPVVIASTVAAQEQTTTTTKPATTTPAPLTDAQKQAMQERLQQRKDALKLKLTTTQQKRLQSRCKSAQGKITSEQAKINGISTSRAKVHANILKNLAKLETKLKNAGLDTTTLKSQIAVLQTKITTFNTDLAAYKEVVGDLAAMDCVADPTAFQASLQTARTARTKVLDDAKAVKAYNKDVIKQGLAALRAQLEAKKTTNGGTN